MLLSPLSPRSRRRNQSPRELNTPLVILLELDFTRTIFVIKISVPVAHTQIQTNHRFYRDAIATRQLGQSKITFDSDSIFFQHTSYTWI